MYKVNNKIFDSFINAIKYKNSLIDNNKKQYVSITRVEDNTIWLYTAAKHNDPWKK